MTMTPSRTVRPTRRIVTAVNQILLVASIMMLAADAVGDSSYSGVVGFQKVEVQEGRNYIGTPFDSQTASNATLSSVLDTRWLPAAAAEATATVVDMWDQDAQALTNRYWLSDAGSSNVWRRSGGTEVADDTLIDREKGIVVTVRAGQSTQTVFLVGLVSDDAMEQVVVSNGYTLAASPFPEAVSLTNSGLIASGFTGGTNYVAADNLLFFDTATGHFDLKVWYDSNSSTWRHADTTPATRQLEPGESFLVRRRARGSNMTWNCACPYVLP